MQVCWSTARSWAIAIGCKFNKHKKGYYVDGHDRADVLEHRKEWLAKELELELRQYLWVQLTVDQATELKLPGYDIPAVSTTASSTASTTTSSPSMNLPVNKIKLRFSRAHKQQTCVKSEPSVEEQQRQNKIKETVQRELVYPYTNQSGQQMVEVHVDLLPQNLRSSLSTKLTIHGFEFDMGGNLSVRFPVGETPIIKVGTDEVIFKMYAMNKSSWSVNGTVKLMRKTEGKGNMKIV